MTSSRTLRTVLAGLALASTASLAPLAAAPASATGSPHQITVTLRAGTDGKGGQLGGSYAPVLSPNGRFLAFTAIADQNVYVEDLQSGQAHKVSTTPGGQAANGSSTAVAVNDNGQRIAFTSQATNLAAGPHSYIDLYVRDTAAHTTKRVNLLPNNVLSAVSTHAASMDAAGTVVAWTSTDYKVWARHLDTSTTEQVDVSSAELPSDGFSHEARVTGDGKHVTFASSADNLVTPDTNGTTDVFERFLGVGSTIRVSMTNGGGQSLLGGTEGSASANGRFVAFTSSSQDLVSGDTNGAADIFVRDVQLATTKRVSLLGFSLQANSSSDEPTISADGSTVFFRSLATDLDPIGQPDATSKANLFRRPLSATSTTQVDRSVTGASANGLVSEPSATSADGSVVAFTSDSTNLVKGDTNGKPDVFVRLPEAMGPHTDLHALAASLTADFGGSPASVPGTTALLTNGQLTVGHLVSNLAHAPVWAKDREPVARLYTAYFHREADLGGLNHWVNKHASGSSLNAISAEFAKSNEFKTKYGKVSDADFVKLVYTNVLERPADAGGLAHWVAQLQGGMTRGAVMVQFSESSEGKRHLAMPVEATLIGLGMLHQMPTTEYFQKTQFAWLYLGGDEAAANFLLTSPPYLARF